MTGFKKGIAGAWYNYTGDACPKCGRVRVMITESGKRMCEKCLWIIEDSCYGSYYEDDED